MSIEFTNRLDDQRRRAATVPVCIPVPDVQRLVLEPRKLEVVVPTDHTHVPDALANRTPSRLDLFYQVSSL